MRLNERIRRVETLAVGAGDQEERDRDHAEAAQERENQRIGCGRAALDRQLDALFKSLPEEHQRGLIVCLADTEPSKRPWWDGYWRAYVDLLSEARSECLAEAGVLKMPDYWRPQTAIQIVERCLATMRREEASEQVGRAQTFEEKQRICYAFLEREGSALYYGNWWR